MINRYYWSGISSEERIKALSELTEIVDHNASILQFQRFSDISIGLCLEMPECRLNELQKALAVIMSVECPQTNLAHSAEDCIVLLNITFTRGMGNLEIEAPSFPE